MIPRTGSSRRRRASRSVATSPLHGGGGAALGRRPSSALGEGCRARRASIAAPPSRSPSLGEFVTVTGCDDEEPPHYDRSPRGSIAGSRNNLLLEPYSRSPRGSLVPEVDHFKRSSRGSLLPEEYNRSPRGSLVPEYSRSPRNSLVPDPNRSPRGSLIPDPGRSPRGSLVPDPNRSPRGSLVPDPGRSPRGSIAHESNRSSRGSLVPESLRSPRGSLVPDPNRSPRGSLVPDPNRSPRGSLVPEGGRNSIAGESMHNRSPRGSIASESSYCRSPRNSLPLQDTPSGRSPRGSLGSTGGYSLDAVTQGGRSGVNRSSSPYRGSRGSGGGGSQGFPHDSRRPSSSPLGGVKALLIGPALVTTQVALSSNQPSNYAPVSGDDRRQLCEHSKLSAESGSVGGVTSYGSVVYQLNHANIESSSLCDFVFKALGIVYRTVVVTVVLVCLTTLPIVMFIIGVQFVRDCPREPAIPVYLIVGGVVGTVKMVWATWRQVGSRRFERLGGGPEPRGPTSRIASLLLTAFLLVWFALGNLWVLGILWPAYRPTLYEPDAWCDRTLYFFCLAHLAFLYALLVLAVLVLAALVACQICLCPLIISSK